MFKYSSSTFQILLFNVYLLFIITINGQEDRTHLLSDPACGIYFYSNGGSATFVGVTPADNKTQRTSLELSAKPSFTAKCNKSSSGIEEKEIELIYASPNEIINSLKLKIKISVAENVFWNISEILVAVEGAKGHKFPSNAVQMRAKEVYVPDRFSYSCNEMQLRTRPRNAEQLDISIELRRFQLQPIGSAQSTIFYDSFDCSQWLTIPIWMGFLTLLLFSLVVGLGICLLFDIKTMDRFEDPKGKMINVPVAE